LEAVLVAPVAVAIGTAFVQRGILVRENEPDVEIRVLVLDQQVLLSVIDCPATLGLDIKKATRFWQLKVRRVGGLSFRPCVADLVRLIFDDKTSLADLVGNLGF
jgi:hypothetical protein